MAITIIATPNAADANSYLTLADAQAIIDGMVLDADATAWAAATTDNKNRALYSAAQRLDRERFLGARSTDTQSMQWPRTGVRKPDTYINTYAVGFLSCPAHGRASYLLNASPALLTINVYIES